MALNYIVDTSVVKRLGRSEIRMVIQPLATAGDTTAAHVRRGLQVQRLLAEGE